MATLCDTTCGAAAAAPTPYDASCVVTTRKIGAEHFFLIPCDESLDMNDAAAVAAAVSAGTIQKSPRGKITRNRGDQQKIEDAFGCGDDIILNRTQLLAYSTYLASCNTVDDDTYWAAVNDGFLAFRMFWVDCCGKIYIDQGADNPGFKINLTETFEFVEGESNYGQWTGGFEIETSSSIIPIYDLTVVSALGVSINVN